MCDSDRRRIDRDLTSIERMHSDLADPGPIESDQRWYEVINEQGRGTGQLRRRDPVAALLPVAAIPGRSGQPIVSGSRDHQTPVDLDIVDLTAPARSTNATQQGRQHPNDQVGRLSVRTQLDQWVRAWRTKLWPHQNLPVPTVPNLVGWLRRRLDEGLDRHPAVPEFAAELRSLVGALRHATGDTEPKPAVMWGIPCRKCLTPSALQQQAGDPYRECTVCGLLLNDAEYRQWLRDIADAAKRKQPTSA